MWIVTLKAIVLSCASTLLFNFPIFFFYVFFSYMCYVYFKSRLLDGTTLQNQQFSKESQQAVERHCEILSIEANSSQRYIWGKKKRWQCWIILWWDYIVLADVVVGLFTINENSLNYCLLNLLLTNARPVIKKYMNCRWSKTQGLWLEIH